MFQVDNEFDDEETQVGEKITKPTESKSSILVRLRERELLRYGSLITEDQMQYVMNVKKKDIDPIRWQLTVLQLREIIKSDGYFVTSRGRDDKLYILTPNEMPLYNERKNKSNFRSLKQRQRALHMIDDTTLGLEARKKLEFEMLRNASLEIEMASKIKERCRY